MNKKQKQAEEIVKHGLILWRYFGNGTPAEPKTLCKALHRIEMAWQRKAEAMCNGTMNCNDDRLEKMIDRTKKRIVELLPNLPIEQIEINLDPRGYALKVQDKYIYKNKISDLRRDWGGYGILSPEF